MRFDVIWFTQCIVTWDQTTDIWFNVGRGLMLYL